MMERDLEVIFEIGERGRAVHEERRQSDNPWFHGNVKTVQAQYRTENARYYQVGVPSRRSLNGVLPMALAIGTILLPMIGPRRQTMN